MGIALLAFALSSAPWGGQGTLDTPGQYPTVQRLGSNSYLCCPILENHRASLKSDQPRVPVLLARTAAPSPKFRFGLRLGSFIDPASDYSENRCGAHSQSPAYFLRGLSVGIPFVNQGDLVISELCLVTVLTEGLRAVSEFVRSVLFRCSPTKVIETVVVAATVEVATLHSLWTRAHKSSQNKSMDKARFAGFVPASHCEQVNDTLFYGAKSEPAFDRVSEGLDSPSVRDTKFALPSDYIPPVFAGTVVVGLDALVELFGEGGVAICHGPSPVKDFQRVKRAGGLETALRVYSPSPCFSTDTNFKNKGEEQ